MKLEIENIPYLSNSNDVDINLTSFELTLLSNLTWKTKRTLMLKEFIDPILVKLISELWNNKQLYPSRHWETREEIPDQYCLCAGNCQILMFTGKTTRYHPDKNPTIEEDIRFITLDSRDEESFKCFPHYIRYKKESNGYSFDFLDYTIDDGSDDVPITCGCA